MARRSMLGRAESLNPSEMLRSIKKKSKSEDEITWRQIFGKILSHRRMLVRANLLALFSMLATISLPLLLPLLIDEVVLNQPGHIIPALKPILPQNWETTYGYVAVITIATISLRSLGLSLDVLHSRIFSMISKDLIYDIRIRALGYLRQVSVGNFETLGAGKIANHFTTDINTIDDFTSVALSKFLIGVLSLCGVLFVMIWISPLLTLFLVLFNPAVGILTQKLGKYVKNLKKKENASLEMFQLALTETFDAIRQIKVSNRERQFFSHLDILSEDVKEQSAEFSWRNDAAEKMSMFVFMFGFDVFRAFAILLVAVTTLSIGEMFAMIGYLWFMLGSVQSILQIQYGFHSANGALERINGLLAMPREEDYECKINPFVNNEPVSLQIKNLSFGYSPQNSILNDISLSIKAGEKVGIKGESGCGKSTLVQVIMGLYRMNSGQIFYNDVALEDIGYATVRANVAAVLQHPSQLNTSLRVNLCLGNEYTDEELWQALRVAQLDDIVENMPNKLDSQIGTRGVRLSGGQLQRLAIARVLLTRPSMLILDEATSALDENTEAKLHKSLNEQFTHITALIVAHRTSALNQADHVYEMKDGRLIQV